MGDISSYLVETVVSLFLQAAFEVQELTFEFGQGASERVILRQDLHTFQFDNETPDLGRIVDHLL